MWPVMRAVESVGKSHSPAITVLAPLNMVAETSPSGIGDADRVPDRHEARMTILAGVIVKASTTSPSVSTPNSRS